MPTRVIDSRFLAGALRSFLTVLGPAEAAIRRPATEERAPDPPSPEDLRPALQSAIDASLVTSERAGFAPDSPALQQTRYLLALTADRRLLSLDWVGHDAWDQQPLVAANPAIAGTPAGLVAQAEALVRGDLGATSVSSAADAQADAGAGTVRGPERAALAEVYLVALAVAPIERSAHAPSSVPGEDTRAHATLRHQLRSIVRAERGDAGERPEPLFGDAYRHTQRRGPVPRLADPRGWGLALAAVVLALLAVSFYPLWPHAIEPARTSLHSLLDLLAR